MERGEHLHVVGEVVCERALERLASEHHHLARLRRQLLEHLRFRAPACKARVRWESERRQRVLSAATATLGSWAGEPRAEREREKDRSRVPYHDRLGEENAQLEHVRRAQERHHVAPFPLRPERHLRVAVAVAELVEALEQLRRHALDLREQLRWAIKCWSAREKDHPRRPLLWQVRWHLLKSSIITHYKRHIILFIAQHKNKEEQRSGGWLDEEDTCLGQRRSTLRLRCLRVAQVVRLVLHRSRLLMQNANANDSDGEHGDKVSRRRHRTNHNQHSEPSRTVAELVHQARHQVVAGDHHAGIELLVVLRARQHRDVHVVEELPLQPATHVLQAHVKVFDNRSTR